MTLALLKSGDSPDAAPLAARSALDSWQAVFDEGDPPASIFPPLLALADAYGVERTMRDATPRALWDRLRPVLALHAYSPAPDDVKPQEREAIEEARAAVLAMPIPPGVRGSRSKAVGESMLCSPHGDETGWTFQLCQAFGTRSLAVVNAFVSALVDASGCRWGDIDENRINAGLAMIAGQKPKNEMQAALCAHIVILHWSFLDLSAAAAQAPGRRERDASAAARVCEAINKTLDQLARLQGKKRKHQVVINVTKTERYELHLHGEGGSGFGGQPFGTNGRVFHGSGKLKGRAEVLEAFQSAASAPMRSEDPAGDGLRSGGDEG